MDISAAGNCNDRSEVVNVHPSLYVPFNRRFLESCLADLQLNPPGTNRTASLNICNASHHHSLILIHLRSTNWNSKQNVIYKNLWILLPVGNVKWNHRMYFYVYSLTYFLFHDYFIFRKFREWQKKRIFIIF